MKFEHVQRLFVKVLREHLPGYLIEGGGSKS